MRKIWIPISVLLIICFSFLIAPNDPHYVDMSNRLADATLENPLGTDVLGRCVLSRIMYGGLTTIGIVLIAGLIVLFFGIWIGLLISQRDRIIFDSLLNAITAIPPIAYLIIFVSTWGNSLKTMIVAITISLILRVIKLVKSRTEVEMSKAYITCAKACGAGSLRVKYVHILPNIMDDVLAFICLSCADTILAIVGFSFIGIGLGDELVDWGKMVLEAKQLIQVKPILTIFPVLMIFITTVSFYNLGTRIGEKNARN